MNPGHAVTFTKGNERMGITRKPILPTPEDVAILRRAAAGFVLVSIIDGKMRVSYEDGTPVSPRWRDPSGARMLQKMVSNGWLIPDKNDTLFDVPLAQIYRARKP